MNNEPVDYPPLQAGGIIENNQPVALMTEYGIQPLHEGALQEGQFLYTHPVKELTDEVRDALMDALSGWKYIRHIHGDLYGVGWDRVQDKLEAILRKAQEK